MFDNNYVPYILKPTRVTHVSSTLIDNIFVKVQNLSRSWSYIVTDPMSDHYPCFLSYSMTDVKLGVNRETILEKHKLTEDAIVKLQQYLLFHNWSDIYDMNVVDSYKYLVEMITGYLDIVAPRKSIRLRVNEKFRDPWVTVALKKCDLRCKKLCSKARRSCSESDHQHYKMYRKKIMREVKTLSGII